MLKKSFTILAAFILGLIISISIMACADDISDYSNDDNDVKYSKTANVESYRFINEMGEGAIRTYSYDKTGRLIQITVKENDHTRIWTCSYNKNVCTVTDGSETQIYTLADEDSQDFSTIQNIILTRSLSWTVF